MLYTRSTVTFNCISIENLTSRSWWLWCSRWRLYRLDQHGSSAAAAASEMVTDSLHISRGMEPVLVRLGHTTDETKNEVNLSSDTFKFLKCNEQFLSVWWLTDFQTSVFFSTSSGREPNCSGKSSATLTMSSHPCSGSQSKGFLRELFSKERLPIHKGKKIEEHFN